MCWVMSCRRSLRHFEELECVSLFRNVVSWAPLSPRVWKFHVNRETRGKPSLARIGGVLRNSDGRVLTM